MDYQKYIYWQDGDMWLGYLERYPDYWTQGETQEDLRENLRDIYDELTGGHVPCVPRGCCVGNRVKRRDLIRTLEKMGCTSFGTEPSIYCIKMTHTKLFEPVPRPQRFQ